MKKNKLSNSKKSRILTCCFFILITGFYLISCNKKNFGNNVAQEATVTSGVTINATDTLSLLEGKDSTLSFSVVPDSISNPGLKWSTSDSTIATVKNGVISAKSVGYATITAIPIDGSAAAAAIVVSVIDHVTEVTSINFTNVTGDTSLYQGDAFTITTGVLPANATYRTLTWSSSDPAVATVSSSGTIKGITTGTATITATATDGSNVAKAIKITVLQLVEAQSLSVTSASPDTIGPGQNFQVMYNVTPSNATLSRLVWSSNNTAVATVSSTGLVSGIAAGTARITVTSQDNATVTGYIDIVVVAGKIDDEFTTLLTPWITSTSGATVAIQNGKFVVTMVLTGGKYRGDFQRKGGATVDAGSYPVIAFKMLRPAGAAGGANVTFDTNLGSFGNGANKFTTLTAGDGTTVYYYNIATGTFGSGTTLSTTTATTLTTFQLKVADLVLTSDEVAAGKNIYYVDWVKSFKSVNELQAYIQ